MEDAEQELLKSHAQDQQSLSQSFQILLFAPKLENAISQMQEGEWGYLLTGDRGIGGPLQAGDHGFLRVSRASDGAGACRRTCRSNCNC